MPTSPDRLPDDTDPLAAEHPVASAPEPAAEEPAARQQASEPSALSEPSTPATPGELPATQDEPPVPSEAELEATATPATVRRAPKFSAFITFGALGGMVLGLLLAVVIHPEKRLIADGTGFISFLDGEGAVRTVMVVAVGVVGAFVGGALAVRADRRSGPPRRRGR
ncbi:histidine kinase [Cellulomonas edaphi]|uniref:Histidine kinase n=1 Tax=Cellulomonas edaphi TaxID=3053468 RepID=A0ABT7SBQ7_9CELL|nr:histidine kinase [Cellulomons edaphi]MDM7832369.1 histidine kinase [Cellulomons edaphi]